jgi:uncharacterized protein (TIGR04552 family)
LSIAILEQVRLLLRGGSVIDWYKLGFGNEDAVRDFLCVNKFDVDNPADEQRIRMLFRLGHEYLSDDLGYEIADHIWNPDSVLTPFLIASNAIGKEQQQACILLKVLHTINHLQARELRHNLPLPDAEIFETVEEWVGDRMEKLIDEGLPIAQFTGGRKTLESTLTKLLSKRRATAAEILDRLRFRIIVNTSTDIPLVLARMIQTVLPFNYVIPEESTNDIVNVRRYLNSLASIDSDCMKELQFDLALEETDPLRRQFNECSAEQFRMLNFVVDLPIRVDHVLERPEYEQLKRLGHLVFVTVEFQVFDRQTFDYNEQDSDASHNAYKLRQKDRVRHRLEFGLEEHNNALRSQILDMKRSEK